MTQGKGDRRDPGHRHLMSVVPLSAAVEQPVPTEDAAELPRPVVVPGPWRWFVHRDIQRSDNDRD